MRFPIQILHVLLYGNDIVGKIPDDGYRVTCRAVSSQERSVGWLTKLEQKSMLSIGILRTQLVGLVEHCTVIAEVVGLNPIHCGLTCMCMDT